MILRQKFAGYVYRLARWRQNTIFCISGVYIGQPSWRHNIIFSMQQQKSSHVAFALHYKPSIYLITREQGALYGYEQDSCCNLEGSHWFPWVIDTLIMKMNSIVIRNLYLACLVYHLKISYACMKTSGDKLGYNILSILQSIGLGLNVGINGVYDKRKRDVQSRSCDF